MRWFAFGYRRCLGATTPEIKHGRIEYIMTFPSMAAVLGFPFTPTRTLRITGRRHRVEQAHYGVMRLKTTRLLATLNPPQARKKKDLQKRRRPLGCVDPLHFWAFYFE